MIVLVLFAAAAVLEAVGLAGAFITANGSLLFDLSMRAIDGGLFCAVMGLITARRRSVEAAFELGVQVGERRGRRIAKPVVVVMPDDDGDGPRGRHLRDRERERAVV